MLYSKLTSLSNVVQRLLILSIGSFFGINILLLFDYREI